MTTLHDLAQAYLSNTENSERYREITVARLQSLPWIQECVRDFLDGRTTFDTMRSKLNRGLRPSDERNFASNRFLMDINKFEKHHNNLNNRPAEQLKSILRLLYEKRVGESIEQCYHFLLAERERLRRAGKPSGMLVAPVNSAPIITMFAAWLNPDEDSIICSEGVRKTLNTLVRQQLLTPAEGLKLTTNSTEITNAEQYNAFIATCIRLRQAIPAIVTSPYWCEYFMYWLQSYEQSTQATASTTLIKEIDSSDRLSQPPTRTLTEEDLSPVPGLRLPSPSVSTGPLDPEHIEPGPLQPTPEPLLTSLIHEVQRHIVVDASVIRRIYHALLAGHVILTGPPGTGKTQLARLLPEILWRSSSPTDLDSSASIEHSPTLDTLLTTSAYTTRLVTATDDWSPRTLISGIMPHSQNGSVHYKIQFGHLTSTILKNWSFQGEQPAEWSHQTLQRTRVSAASSLDRSSIQPFKGQWLVIDEFNRAPIDLALGDALTALGGGDVLRVTIENGSAELPIPQDFRIIGTLNSFDRNYLNQMSEALKRRFSFIEVLPPTRAHRQAEQGIVLFKALTSVRHLSPDSILPDEQLLYWENHLTLSAEPDGGYTIDWEQEQDPFRLAFESAWRLYEVIRIYRQLGTAQAISLVRHMLISGLLQNYADLGDWLRALDVALSDTISDQLQVLLPVELETLLLYLNTPSSSFSPAFNRLLQDLSASQQQLYRQLLTLSSVVDEQGQPFLSDGQITDILHDDRPELPSTVLNGLFHLDSPAYPLPQFARRLRTFWTERGL